VALASMLTTLSRLKMSKYRIVKFVSETGQNHGVVKGGTVIQDGLDPKAARAWMEQYTTWSQK
jgi:hypothetical protein